MNYQLLDFVKQYGGTEKDAEMLEKFSRNTEVKRLERIARSIASDYHIQLKVQYFAGSYSTKQGTDKNPYVFICIDPTMVYEPGLSYEEAWQRVLGIVAHEAGHIAYTDFHIVKKNGEMVGEKQRQIPLVAKELKDIYDGKSNGNVNDAESKLKDAIINYVYARNLPTMLNSVEDASVEFAVSGMSPNYYAPLVAVRDFIFSKEEETLDYRKQTNEIDDILETLMTEIRQFGVIAYRKQFSPRFLPRFFSPKEIKDMQRLALYGRAAAVDTQERNIISKVLLDMLLPQIEKEAETFFDEYLDALKMDSQDFADVANNMMQNFFGEQKKVTITGNLDSALSGMNQPSTPSKYNLDLPADLQKKIDDKKQEESEQSTQSGAGDDTSNEDGRSSSSDTATANGEGKSEGMPEENAESEGKSDSKSEENKEGEEGASAGQAGESKDVDELISESAIQKESERAKTETNENLKKIQKEFEGKTEKEMRDSIEGKSSGKSGKAPLCENLGNPNSISDAHKNVKTRYIDAKSVHNSSLSYEGTRAKKNQDSLMRQANQFSRKLKEVLMYQAKTRRKNGLRSGQLHDAALSRIVTDQRVFKKTIQGNDKKARIVVLLDLSGSMGGDKLSNAIQAAYMLAESCAKIKVPISIMGHDYSGGYMNLYHFLEFEKYLKKEERENLFHAHSGGCNHDGLAIFHNLTDLVRHRQSNEQLIQLVISDGSPNGEGNYGGDYAMRDIQQIIATFEKQYNTHTIGIGIGNDVSHVAKIYKDYLLVPDVTTLSDELLKILKSILL